MNNVKKYRGKIGLTQSQLADKIGVTRALIVNLEKEDCHSTSQSTTEALCELFEISPCELYGVDNFKYFPESKKDCEYLISILNAELKKWE